MKYEEPDETEQQGAVAAGREAGAYARARAEGGTERGETVIFVDTKCTKKNCELW